MLIWEDYLEIDLKKTEGKLSEKASNKERWKKINEVASAKWWVTGLKPTTGKQEEKPYLKVSVNVDAFPHEHPVQAILPHHTFVRLKRWLFAQLLHQSGTSATLFRLSIRRLAPDGRFLPRLRSRDYMTRVDGSDRQRCALIVGKHTIIVANLLVGWVVPSDD